MVRRGTERETSSSSILDPGGGQRKRDGGEGVAGEGEKSREGKGT